MHNLCAQTESSFRLRQPKTQAQIPTRIARHFSSVATVVQSSKIATIAEHSEYQDL